jgi:NADP-dependent alcohol dehydrogenase
MYRTAKRKRLNGAADVAQAALRMPPDYNARANYMWAATCALNHTLSRGVPEDWATHNIGHELTALYGLDHAETLAAVLPWLLWYKRKQKQGKLLQYGYRVLGIKTQKYDARSDQTIEATAAFSQPGHAHHAHSIRHRS